MRTIIIGDVHGCYEEFQKLLDKVRASSTDRIISVGDLICRGPSSAKTLEIALSMKNLECVLGNHEFYL